MVYLSALDALGLVIQLSNHPGSSFDRSVYCGTTRDHARMHLSRTCELESVTVTAGPELGGGRRWREKFGWLDSGCE